MTELPFQKPVRLRGVKRKKDRPSERAALKFAKPVRVVDDKLLRQYQREHIFCEVLTCGRRGDGEPHHLVPRARGRDDRFSNLARLCAAHHLEYHDLGGKRWFRKYQTAMLPELAAKVRRALREEG